ncbi:hypothetical protein Y1Q_0023787 [Alligator mississippiensis]|uniref:Uncharacterized protein n=1 Tax=Alligator mississippiensis TaxID=8496 RepID=A0A151MK49_ALLMI|nr:hypothetical protein Y1Q_0023787 [Alligator mississippiensis]
MFPKATCLTVQLEADGVEEQGTDPAPTEVNIKLLSDWNRAGSSLCSCAMVAPHATLSGFIVHQPHPDIRKLQFLCFPRA